MGKLFHELVATILQGRTEGDFKIIFPGVLNRAAVLTDGNFDTPMVMLKSILRPRIWQND